MSINPPWLVLSSSWLSKKKDYIRGCAVLRRRCDSPDAFDSNVVAVVESANPDVRKRKVCQKWAKNRASVVQVRKRKQRLWWLFFLKYLSGLEVAMSGEDPRRVADYFVVAGLPRDVEKQQPLDDYGLEVSLKPSAYQDPITDITVRRRNTSAAGKILSSNVLRIFPSRS